MSKAGKTVHIKITDRSGATIEQMKEAVALACEAIGSTAEGHAKDNTPVDTGRLRNSIAHATKKTESRGYGYRDNNGNSFSYHIGGGAKESAVYIGTNVEYGAAIELGGPHSYPHHMLLRAASEHGAEYKEITEAAIRAELE